jgi:hypothetical protein
LSHISSPFCLGYFGDGVSQTICSGWPQTMILRISASLVARIMGMSHLVPSFSTFLMSTCGVQDTVLAAEEAAVRKANLTLTRSLHSLQ